MQAIGKLRLMGNAYLRHLHPDDIIETPETLKEVMKTAEGGKPAATSKPKAVKKPPAKKQKTKKTAKKSSTKTTTANAPKKRGRPKGSKNKPKTGDA